MLISELYHTFAFNWREPWVLWFRLFQYLPRWTRSGTSQRINMFLQLLCTYIPLFKYYFLLSTKRNNSENPKNLEFWAPRRRASGNTLRFSSEINSENAEPYLWGNCYGGPPVSWSGAIKRLQEHAPIRAYIWHPKRHRYDISIILHFVLGTSVRCCTQTYRYNVRATTMWGLSLYRLPHSSCQFLFLVRPDKDHTFTLGPWGF